MTNTTVPTILLIDDDVTQHVKARPASMSQTSPPLCKTAVLDPARIGSYRKRRPGFLERLIQAYLEEAPKHIAGIKTGAATGDMNATRHAAHTLKSASANLGADRLSAICRTIESAALGEDRDTLARLAETVGGEMVSVERALKGVLFEQGNATA